MSLVLLLAVTACGKTGPLYLPDDTAQQQDKDTSQATSNESHR